MEIHCPHCEKPIEISIHKIIEEKEISDEIAEKEIRNFLSKLKDSEVTYVDIISEKLRLPFEQVQRVVNKIFGY